ncbi:MAG: hypothetical protein JNJ73_20105 [Hyphomonadaceae bacterium]|nr:hypothetical protein [Hyphomonadaceae bacterium]
MRRLLIAMGALVALSACASSGPTSAGSAGTWNFTYDSATGVARAAQSDAGATIQCQAPNGDMLLVDSVLGGRGVTSAEFKIGQHPITVPAQSNGRQLTIRLPRRPPNLGAYAHLSQEPVSVTAGGRTHAYAPDAVQKIAQVANACWPSGS